MSSVAEKPYYPATVVIKSEDDLYLNGRATDHIWLMEDKEGLIGVRLDCGDSGVVYLTPSQAKELAEQLNSFVAPEIRAGLDAAFDLLEFHEGSATPSHPGAHPSVSVNGEDWTTLFNKIKAARGETA